MELIATNQELASNLSRLIRTYDHVSFAVAWASANTAVFQSLVKHSTRIAKGVIGTHFYQTHPDVLDVFIGSKSVRFMLQPTGVFHPKLYVFWNSQQWEVLIGSANLTSGALTTNAEAMVLLTGADDSSGHLRDQVVSLIDGYWEDAAPATKSMVAAYREVWKRKEPAVRKLAGQYGKAKPRKPLTDSSVMSMFLGTIRRKVKGDQYHGFKERCELLAAVQEAFTRNKDFASMDTGLRKTIAGLPNDFNDRWAWFGSMKGAGYFHQAVNDNSPHLSRALDAIPLRGYVTRSQYDAYLEEFKKAFPKGRHGVGVASRLLALKRPDQFVCFDSKNCKELCADFGIRQTGMDYDRYWEEIVERIADSPWWNAPRPQDATDAAIWDGRAAMLDAIFYRE